MKSYNPSIASSWLSDPSTEGVGPNVGLGGADEIDSGKTTSHVSLGKDCVVIALYILHVCLLTIKLSVVKLKIMSVIQLVLEYYQPCTVHSATLLIFTPTIITIMHNL